MGCSSFNSDQDAFMITRSFKTDIGSVYHAWIDPVKFVSWLGPAGANMKFLRTSVKEGDFSQWTMTTSDGQTKYGRLDYQTIRPPKSLIYTQNFTDKEGQLTKPFFASTYPDKLLTTVSFVADGKSKTTLSVKWEIVGPATDAERKTFKDLKETMKQGWGESFDKLDALLIPSNFLPKY